MRYPDIKADIIVFIEVSGHCFVRIPYLQAFKDVNKRTSRLVANIPLFRNNFKPLSFSEVSKEAHVSAMLGVYEKNNFSLAVDLFIWAYQRSCQLYSGVQSSMGEPNPIKFKYRTVINEIVRNIVIKLVPLESIHTTILSELNRSNIPNDKKEEVADLVEREVVSLHEGNYARFKIMPSQFQAWKEMPSSASD